MALSVLFNSNMYTYEYFQQEDVCRFCWNRNAFTDIFFEQINNIEIKSELTFKVMECLQIDITRSTFPKKLCEKCRSQIEKFYLFKVFCQETDKKLREIFERALKSSSSPIKLEDDKNEVNEDIPVLNTIDDLDVCENENNIDVEVKPVKNIAKKHYKLKRSPTYCNICRIDLNDLKKFAAHNCDCHGIENGIFKCFGCEKRFKNRKTRLGHEIHYCKGLKDGYKCGVCDRFLPSRRMYESHMRDHRENVSVELPEEIFRCKQCYRLFKTKDSLNEHVQEHGVIKKNFVCENCGRVFTRQDYLHKHKLTHTGEKQHVCPHCDFRTTQRSSLVVHIRKHTGERPYSCDVCPQRCVSSSNLRAHRRRHLGIKQHQCTICGKRFGYKVTLAEHVCSAHTPSAPQSCPLCPARYSRPRALRRHLRAKHGQTNDQNV